ncbi:hypothetical protein BAE36_24975 [Rhizobium leguminosarum bv. trifolii]|nr:hypothetical protein BAE36_24975 [Rhizobium leguminosarum bv. trifolii]
MKRSAVIRKRPTFFGVDLSGIGFDGELEQIAGQLDIDWTIEQRKGPLPRPDRPEGCDRNGLLLSAFFRLAPHRLRRDRVNEVKHPVAEIDT